MISMKKWENPEINGLGVRSTRDDEGLEAHNPGEKLSRPYNWLCLRCWQVIPAGIEHSHFDCPNGGQDPKPGRS